MTSASSSVGDMGKAAAARQKPDRRSRRAAARPFRPEPMQNVVRRALVDRLRDVKVGSRLPPIRELAGDLGVGQSNLFRAMRELVNEGLIYSRPKLGTYLAREIDDEDTTVSGSTPVPSQPISNSRAAHQDGVFALSGKRIGIVTNPHPDELFAYMSRSIASSLRSMGAATVELSTTIANPPKLEFEQLPDLVILINPPNVTLPRIADRLHWLVVSTSWSQRIAPPTYDLVGIDQQSSAFLAGQHFRELGFTSACFIGSDRRGEQEYDAVSSSRLRGFEAGFGRAVAPEHRVRASTYSILAGGAAFRPYWEIPNRPKAVFAASDDIAIGFLSAAASHNLKAGRDFHLIGFDGQSAGQRLPEGALTTVMVPIDAIIRAAAEISEKRLCHPEEALQAVYLACRLSAGSTVQNNGAGQE